MDFKSQPGAPLPPKVATILIPGVWAPTIGGSDATTTTTVTNVSRGAYVNPPNRGASAGEPPAPPQPPAEEDRYHLRKVGWHNTELVAPAPPAPPAPASTPGQSHRAQTAKAGAWAVGGVFIVNAMIWILGAIVSGSLKVPANVLVYVVGIDPVAVAFLTFVLHALPNGGGG